MTKPNLYCVFDCDDVCPYFDRAMPWLNKFFNIYPKATMTLYVPQNYHGFCDVCNYWQFAEDIDILMNKYSGMDATRSVEIAYHGYFHDSPCHPGCCEYLCRPEYFQHIMETHNICCDIYNCRLIRPPGWQMVHENAQIIKDYGYILAGHPCWYENLHMWGVDESHRPGYNNDDILIFHSHAAAECGKNNIDSENNFNNLINYINKLNEIYNIKWVSSTEIYSKAILKSDANFSITW
jgi:hypothetical protein